jgi:hypothetical protein
MRSLSHRFVTNQKQTNINLTLFDWHSSKIGFSSRIDHSRKAKVTDHTVHGYYCTNQKPIRIRFALQVATFNVCTCRAHEISPDSCLCMGPSGDTDEHRSDKRRGEEDRRAPRLGFLGSAGELSRSPPLECAVTRPPAILLTQLIHPQYAYVSVASGGGVGASRKALLATSRNRMKDNNH